MNNLSIETLERSFKKRMALGRVELRGASTVNKRYKGKQRRESKVKYSFVAVTESDVREVFIGLEDTPEVKTELKKKDFPTKVLDALYRQNYPNYNPYLSALECLEQEQTSQFQQERIKNLCFLGVAKNFLKTKKYSSVPEYSRVNVLIRTYMREKMCEEVKIRSETYENTIFIPTNLLALSFNQHRYPKEMEDIMQEEEFAEGIENVNAIISSEYVKYKASNLQVTEEGSLARLLFYLGIVFILIYCLAQSAPVLWIVLLLLAGWLLMSGVICKGRLEQMVETKNATETIMKKIKDYLKTIKTERVQWKVGEDFYWLEIHYIKKKDFRQRS